MRHRYAGFSILADRLADIMIESKITVCQLATGSQFMLELLATVFPMKEDNFIGARTQIVRRILQ